MNPVQKYLHNLILILLILTTIKNLSSLIDWKIFSVRSVTGFVIQVPDFKNGSRVVTAFRVPKRSIWPGIVEKFILSNFEMALNSKENHNSIYIYFFNRIVCN